MTALHEAASLIYGEKAEAYGDPVENFDRLAALWAPILGVDVTAQQVTLCLLQLKVSRLIHQPGHEDSIVDAAGYVGCYERVTKERGEQLPVVDLGNGFSFDPAKAPRAGEVDWNAPIDDPLDRLAAEIEGAADDPTIVPCSCDNPDGPHRAACPKHADGEPHPSSSEHSPAADTTVGADAIAAQSDPKVAERAGRKLTQRRTDETIERKGGRGVDAVLPTALAKPSTLRNGEAPPDGWLSGQQAAEAYGIAYPTLMGRAYAGTVDNVKIGGRRYFPPPS